MAANSPSFSMRAAPAIFILGWVVAAMGYFSILSENIAAGIAILAWTTSATFILLDRMAKYRADIRPLQSEWTDEETENGSTEIEPLTNPIDLGLDVPL